MPPTIHPIADRSGPSNARSPDPLTVTLAEIGAADAPQVGHKAAHLGELAAAGLPVPDGFVIPAPVCRALDDAEALPPTLIEAVAAGLDALGGGPVAVRSSGVAEDLPGASFAGQYETVLQVEGLQGVLEAVRRCWDSARNERVRAYLAAHGLPAAPLAVLVQRMVDAEVAGVAFSANPVSGARAECVVNGVHGLGDRLVGGEVSPDEWHVGADGPVVVDNPQGAVDAQLAGEVAALARRCAAHFGTPQDIEWARAGGALHLLQSRPITSLPVEPVPIPIEAPEGFWERESTHFPRPLSPLYAERLLPAVRQAMAKMCEQGGILLETLDHREIGGLVYNRVVPPGGKDRKPPPSWTMPLLRRIVPFLRRRIATACDLIREDRAGGLARAWFAGERETYRERGEALRAVDLPSLSDDELLAHYGACWEHHDDALAKHLQVDGIGFVIPVYQAFSACRELLGWEVDKAIELCCGLSTMSTAPGRALNELARLAADRPAVCTALRTAGADIAATLRAVDPEFADAFDAHLREWGCRALHVDILEPTMDETPQLVAALVLGQVTLGFEPDAVQERAAALRRSAIEEARGRLAGRPEDLARFEQLLEGLAAAYPVREDNEFFTISMPLAVLRYAALEVGRRLADKGVIDERDDVFYLHDAEMHGAFAPGTDLRPVVRRRRGERTWAAQADLPASFGVSPGDPPPADWLPAEAKVVLDALLWALAHGNAPAIEPHPENSARGVVGLPASAGVYEGVVRVIADESEFGRLQPGDVLVCPITSPVWSVIFSNVGAVVTDTGGTLSHSAIIAREHRIPAVVGTGNATQLFRDGQRVRVDGTQGRVEALG